MLPLLLRVAGEYSSVVPAKRKGKKKHLKDKGVNIRSFRDDRARNQMARGGEPENADVEDER